MSLRFSSVHPLGGQPAGTSLWEHADGRTGALTNGPVLIGEGLGVLREESGVQGFKTVTI